MPLSAIFKASTLGATSKATARSIRSRLTRSLKAHGEILHALLGDMRIRSPSLSSFSSRSSLRTIGVKVMTSTVGTRPTPGLIDGNSFWATMPLMLKAIALRRAVCISAGNKSRIRPIVVAALDA